MLAKAYFLASGQTVDESVLHEVDRVSKYSACATCDGRLSDRVLILCCVSLSCCKPFFCSACNSRREMDL